MLLLRCSDSQSTSTVKGKNCSDTPAAQIEAQTRSSVHQSNDIPVGTKNEYMGKNKTTVIGKIIGFGNKLFDNIKPRQQDNKGTKDKAKEGDSPNAKKDYWGNDANGYGGQSNKKRAQQDERWNEEEDDNDDWNSDDDFFFYTDKSFKNDKERSNDDHYEVDKDKHNWPPKDTSGNRAESPKQQYDKYQDDDDNDFDDDIDHEFFMR